MIRAAILAFSSLIIAACGSGDDTAQTAFEAVKDGALLVDVRSAAEFAGGHLPGAINIPHGEIVAGLQALETDKQTDIVLYCRSGNRSGIAQASLAEAGYTAAVNAGAYSALKPTWDAIE